MPLTSQASNYFFAPYSENVRTSSVTIQVPNATSLAEIALFDFWSLEEDHLASAFVSQIVSASGVENFTADVPVVFRRNITSINFSITVWNAHAGARWMLHFYT